MLTKTSSRDHFTSTLTPKADRVNCTRSWYTQFPAGRRTSLIEVTLAKIDVHSTSLVDKDVFRKRVLSVSHDRRSPLDSLLLLLYSCRTHGIPLVVQHFPVWRFQHQTMAAIKKPSALEVSQNFVITISWNRDFLSTNAAIKTTGLCRNIWASSRFFKPISFFSRRSSCYKSVWTAPMSLLLPLVWMVSPNRRTTRDGLCSTCSKRLKTSFDPLNSRCQ